MTLFEPVERWWITDNLLRGKKIAGPFPTREEAGVFYGELDRAELFIVLERP